MSNFKQETQLSQRGYAMLPVIEYFAKSLNVTQGHLNNTLEYGMYDIGLSPYGGVENVRTENARLENGTM